ncbi:MAG: YkgJ family cysteine cluster protein [Enterocloster sp.]|uniref:YkgJ family cysteine cluster protein n=1 Tax=Enterocloster sp. TaxID=2719315 RepID=UPI0039999B45
MPTGWLSTFVDQHCGISSTDDVLLRYCEPTPLTDEGLSHLRTQNGRRRCHPVFFCSGNQCSIYAARPRTCRLYPFSVGPGERGRDFEYCLCFDDNQQYHFNGGKVLGQRLGCTTTFPQEDKEFLKQQYLVIPEIGRLMRRMPEELRRAAVFKILFYHYYHL